MTFLQWNRGVGLRRSPAMVTGHESSVFLERVFHLPMPVVGPPIPGPLGEPLEPLPIDPDPGDVGFVPGLVPEVPVRAPDPLELDCGQSACLPALLALPVELPCRADAQSALFPEPEAPMLESPVEPLPLDEGGVFGSTELPEPSVLALVPDVEGVDVCASDIPALNINPASKDIESGFLIISPARF